MPDERLYTDRAELYDAIYHWKDYAAEAATLRATLHAEGVADGARVLEVACGTGGHLAHLRAHFDVAGLDRHAGMLAVARRKVPGVPLVEADMTDFAVDRPYDALVCLFSSIGYLLDAASLRAAADRFARALRPGGALVVEPWLTADVYKVGLPFLQTYQSNDLVIARATASAREGDLAVMHMHWLVVRRDVTDAERFTDRHAMWLCPRDEMARVFDAAGFDVRFEPSGLMRDRGLFVARRRAFPSDAGP